MKGPRECEICHDSTPLPLTHTVAWNVMHGADARLARGECRGCHRSRECVDCHQRKETARYRVHDPSWELVHGIDARVDPTACGTCHLQADCISCHRDDHGRAP